MGATEALRDWQSGWGLLGGIAAMCCMGATDDRNKKAGWRSNRFFPIFFIWTELKDSKFFPGGAYVFLIFFLRLGP